MTSDERSSQLARQLLLLHGRQLTYNVIHASVFQLPSHMLNKIASFLAELMLVLKQVLLTS